MLIILYYLRVFRVGEKFYLVKLMVGNGVFISWLELFFLFMGGTMGKLFVDVWLSCCLVWFEVIGNDGDI